MPISSNPLGEMANLKDNLVLSDERPSPSFANEVLPGFKKAVKSRHSIRIFDGVPMPQEVMRDCLRDAILAPSASNLQTYEFYWLQDEEKKEAVGRYCLAQPAATTAGDLVVVVSRVDRWNVNLKKLIGIMTHNGEKQLPKPVHDYYHKIVPMLMRNDSLGINNFIRRIFYWYRGFREPIIRIPVNRGDHRIYGHVQAALAAQTLMLSLAAHGYESCPLGGIDQKAISKLLGLPHGAEVSMVIAAGTGKPEGLFSTRLRLPYADLVKEV
jgi:nitroreductase